MQNDQHNKDIKITCTKNRGNVIHEFNLKIKIKSDTINHILDIYSYYEIQDYIVYLSLFPNALPIAKYARDTPSHILYLNGSNFALRNPS